MINSIVRGFGFGLGKQAANHVVKNSRMSLGQILWYLFVGVVIGIGLLAGLVYWASNTETTKQAHAQYELEHKNDK